MQPDDKVLKAASVSAVGTPMEMKGDTLIYNASSFRVMSNDNLADLLKKMPGVEVGEDGTVKVNGKEVSKITVGGRTFFLGDNKATLDNLPAKIVDKVKVIDKESESAEFTGIKGEKEKVMDVELKEEYKSGWFGNAKLSGGTTAYGKDGNGFKEKRICSSAARLWSRPTERRIRSRASPAGIILWLRDPGCLLCMTVTRARFRHCRTMECTRDGRWERI